MSVSSAYVTCVSGGKTYTWHFTGVTSIEHNLALNLDNKSSQGADIVNGARNLASQEFLASFAVEIDEGGVSRLQEILTSKFDKHLPGAGSHKRYRQSVNNRSDHVRCFACNRRARQ